MTYSKTADTKMQMNGWTETVKEDIDAGQGPTNHGVYYPKRGVTSVEATFTYSGEMEGTSTALYLITYREGPAPVLAVERFTGTIGGLEGSCVWTSTGTQAEHGVDAMAEIVTGMGTGGLAGLRGKLHVSLQGAPPDDGYPLTLEYDVD